MEVSSWLSGLPLHAVRPVLQHWRSYITVTLPPAFTSKPLCVGRCLVRDLDYLDHASWRRAE